MRAYDQIAEWYTAVRDPAVGAPEVTALIEALSPGAAVLDVGCGDGVPVSTLFVRAGLSVVGLDSSREMIARYRARFPDVPARCERISDARFAPASFDAVVAWGVLFHLDEAEQAAAIRSVATWLVPGGRFLFTSGDEAGVREGEMNGVAFRYRSLSAQGYLGELRRAGLQTKPPSTDGWGNVVYDAVKRA